MRHVTILMIFIALAGCAKPQIIEKRYAQEHVLHMSQYRALKDLDAINRHVAYLNQGDVIPLKLEIKSDFIGLVQDQVDLVAKQSVFFRITLPETLSQKDLDKILSLNQERLTSMTPGEKRALFKDVMLFASKDGTTWAPLNDMRALKEIFGIEGGELGFGVAMSEAEGVWASFSVILHKRNDQ